VTPRPHAPRPPARQGAPGFPFAAVVGLEDVKLALSLGAVDRRLGGVLLRGQKGSAKTTLARGLAELLPGDPPPPFVELPLGASEDRVVGTLDLSAALRSGERKFHPGLLAAADGGLLYVDEVNLLPDHLVDVLLDVAVSGVNRVEREGVSHEHPSRFFLIGSMNPEEGELRPQLLDRFGLSVTVASPVEPVERAEAVSRRLAYDADPLGFVQEWAPAGEDLRRRLAHAATRRPRLPEDVLALAARLAVEVGADGLRADLALARAAAALAAWEGRDVVEPEDVARVAPLALGHRRRRGPFDDPTMPPEELEEALSRATSSGGAGGGGEALGEPSGGDPPGGGTDTEAGDGGGAPAAGAAPPASFDLSDAGASQLGVPIGAVRGRSRPGEKNRPQPSGGRLGARDRSLGSAAGRAIAARPVPEGEPPGRVAVAQTVMAASARRRAEQAGAPGRTTRAALVEGGDLHQVLTETRRPHLVVLCVDASGSMGAGRRMTAARGAVLSLLTDAYQRRDRLAVVTFGGTGAVVALRPTASIEVARARLASLATGGRTPLGEGIVRALEVCQSPATAAYAPVLVLVSDGRATLGPPGIDPVDAARLAARRVAAAGVTAVVVDVESDEMPLGLAGELAEEMGARYVRAGRPTAEGLDRLVRSLITTTA